MHFFRNALRGVAVGHFLNHQPMPNAQLAAWAIVATAPFETGKQIAIWQPVQIILQVPIILA